MRAGSPKEVPAAHGAPTRTPRAGGGRAVGAQGRRQDVERPCLDDAEEVTLVPCRTTMALAANRATSEAAARSRSSSSAHTQKSMFLDGPVEQVARTPSDLGTRGKRSPCHSLGQARRGGPSSAQPAPDADETADEAARDGPGRRT